MKRKRIEKRLEDLKVRPHLIDYEKIYKEFQWEEVASQFEGLPGGGLNIAHEAIDRHANGVLVHKTALVWLGEDGQRREFTFMQMKQESNKFANVLRSLGLSKGDRVFTLSTRLPEL
ncbi:MAG: AMP-binding protein, partial [Sulfurovum sp.]|nr:AMP-binding protein [Sulfurovum sp.]